MRVVTWDLTPKAVQVAPRWWPSERNCGACSLHSHVTVRAWRRLRDGPIEVPSPTTLRVRAKDFVPKKDLIVYFKRSR
jgi:hypothetical protein